MEIGDIVELNIFYKVINDCLYKLSVKPYNAKIIKKQILPTFGNTYLLEDSNGKNLGFWYYEEQLKKIDAS
jgi:hypothetical protein